jgi:hypothetical protein
VRPSSELILLAVDEKEVIWEVGKMIQPPLLEEKIRRQLVHLAQKPVESAYYKE